jgi:hypothetical protein
VSFPQLWFVVRKLIMITKEGQYSEDNFRNKSMGKLLMLDFAYLSVVVLDKYYRKMENVNYLVITKQIHNISMLSLYLKFNYKLPLTCCAFDWLL